MPHLIIEYSANIETHLDLDLMLDRLHEAATKTGMFPLGGIRVRAYKAEHYRVADCHPDNAFVHATAIVGAGRPLDRRADASRQLFAVLCDLLEPLQSTWPLAISFNMREFDSVLNLKKNNLHEFVRKRRQSPGSDHRS